MVGADDRAASAGTDPHTCRGGLSEIYLHPATGPYAGAAPGYRYREEFDALMAPEVLAACRDASLQLGGFGDFLNPTGALRRRWPVDARSSTP